MEVVWQVDNATTPARLTGGVSLAVDPTVEAPGRIEPAEQKVWRTARGGKLEIPVRLVPKNGEGKPLHSNDKAREVAAHRALKADDGYQRDKATERILERKKLELEASIERLRRESRVALIDYESKTLGHRAA